MHLACPGLWESAAKNALIVTPSAALAGVGRRQYASAQLLAGRTSWPSCQIVAQNAWLTNRWMEARYSSDLVPSLLSRGQELLLWERIIHADRSDLLDSFATARLAGRAASLAYQWELPATLDAWRSLSDGAQFKRWFDSFNEHCRREHWISLAAVWRSLPEWLERGWSNSEPTLFLLDATPPPALSRLLLSRGDFYRTKLFEPAAVSVPRRGYPSQTAEEELMFAARWARDVWEADTLRSIGIFLPNVSARVADIERTFRDIFYPGACRALTDSRLQHLLEAPSAFHVWSRAPLTEQPLVSGALHLLELLHSRVPLGVAGTILRSPWLKGAVLERDVRARADAELRRSRELDVSIDQIVAASARCPILGKLWPAIRRIREQPPSQSFDAWARCFAGLLATLQWPGDNDLNTNEQSQLEGWRNALSELSALSLVQAEADLATALTQLKRLLGMQTVHDGAGWLAPVQILDWTSVPGLHFDAALTTGLGEETWPPSRPAMPFLPGALQYRHNLPGSSQAAVDAERKHLLAALLGCAPHVVASWHGRLSASAQPHIRVESDPGAVWQGKSTWQAFKPAVLEQREDTWAPAYRIEGTVLGGTGIIKSQSHCPFQAFVKYRLNSRALDDGRLGFDERERGGHLHKVLQLVWQRLVNSEELKALPPDKLKQLVAECAREAVRRPSTSSFQQAVTAIELARLEEITMGWLEVEKKRLAPFTAEVVEAESSIDLGGLTLTLRIDRIDRLVNGGLILIDYKSGVQNVKKLECPRPAEPQLLVYAARLGSEVEGVVFGQLKREDIRPLGLTRDAQFRQEGRKKMVDVVGSAWNGRVAEWQAEVEHLAEQFKAGYAAVDPRPHACDFCEHRIVCRIGERAPESDGEAE